MRAVLWLGSIALSILCIGVLNFFWLQGIVTLMRTRPLPLPTTDFVAYYLNALFLGFDGTVLYLLLMHFRGVKENFIDLFWMCVVMIAGLFILTSVITVEIPRIGLWYPHLFSVQLFPF